MHASDGPDANHWTSCVRVQCLPKTAVEKQAFADRWAHPLDSLTLVIGLMLVIRLVRCLKLLSRTSLLTVERWH